MTRAESTGTSEDWLGFPDDWDALVSTIVRAGAYGPVEARREFLKCLNLAPGELYGGVIPVDDPEPGQVPEAAYYLVLLPGEAQNVTWSAARRWAESVGGELPTPRELGLLLAHDLALGLLQRAPMFQKAQYWTATEDPTEFALAWSMGHPPSASYDAKICQLRARAVRRIRATAANTPR